MEEPPSIVPLFPLPNLVLFPGLRVPLHIFEPRYRQMIAEVAERGHGIIGMTLLKGDWEREYYAYPDVFEIGCAGKVEGLAQLPDGRFNLILEGTSEFRIVRELHDRPYRRAEVQWRTADSAMLETDDATMGVLRDLLFRYLGEAAEPAWRLVVQERGLRGAALVNFFCFHLDITPLEKQTLLEALDNRIGCLLDVLTFKLEERKLGPQGPGSGSGIVQ